jgi:hypothetical protein
LKLTSNKLPEDSTSLDELLCNYFKNRDIEGSEIAEIKTRIKGKFHNARGSMRPEQ